MKWFSGRPAHVHYETIKHAMLAVLSVNGSVDLRLSERFWVRTLNPEEKKIYLSIRRAFYRGQDRVVVSPKTGQVLILTPFRYS